MASDITNITGGDDLFNRYKMPRIVAKVEGRGNGIKTRIVNCGQVAKALHRPPSYVCKFFGCELGAQTKIEEKSDVYIVNGAHEQQVLMEVLQKFIKMFVLCANCNLPETDLQVDKKGNIKQVCAACGHSELVNMAHKLCTFIQNHPPEGKSTSKKEARKKKKEEVDVIKKSSRSRKKKTEDDTQSKRSSRSNQTSSQDSNEEEVEENGVENDSLETNVLPPGGLGNANLDELAENAAKSLVISSTNSPKQSKPGKNEGDDHLQWSADTSKEAVKARQAEAAAAAKVLEGLTESKKKKGTVPVENDRKEDPIASLREFSTNHSVPVIAEKVLEWFPSNESSLADQTEQVLRSLLRSEDVKAKGLESKVQMIAGVIRALAASGGNSQVPVEIQWKMCNYTEELCANLAKVPVAVLLKVLYDEDVVEEDIILKWYYTESKTKSGKLARTNASALIEWLENAESESDSSA
ncbi:translation initiation factor eIF-5 [Galdieria sulphuraria]|uniref:Translation initiation factor eIF-5 n=1 Tax=Galdieria sulphuraria TaxID=130081 RepID=M2XC50_GALSU|nr:translation initiation factor eIF-5 [Galdieria sulphuraria]EME27482.1 translation initiation factor eIF-5 [Galdieria sulphuraria]|eukprot:XP_005704002.1 translation initiation factor eIF-5 [Galdieria sulphuraria]